LNTLLERSTGSADWDGARIFAQVPEAVQTQANDAMKDQTKVTAAAREQRRRAALRENLRRRKAQARRRAADRVAPVGAEEPSNRTRPEKS
jgi:predicted nucleic acid-binding Zn ribbon protein